jgi:hypothetical protein
LHLNLKDFKAMKVTFDVECTPDEARRFFGLPDVAPMQEALMKELENQMRDNMRSLDPETMLKTWLPATMQGWGEVQKMFWNQMGGMNPSGAAGKASAAAKAGASSAKTSTDKK